MRLDLSCCLCFYIVDVGDYKVDIVDVGVIYSSFSSLVNAPSQEAFLRVLIEDTSSFMPNSCLVTLLGQQTDKNSQNLLLLQILSAI
jgi:hypothetical protein